MEKRKMVEALEVSPGELPKLLMNRAAGAQWLQGRYSKLSTLGREILLCFPEKPSRDD